jgi:hypothetical protein
VSQRLEKGAEVRRGGYREAVEAVVDDIEVRAVRQQELDGEAARIGAAAGIGNIRQSGEIRESDDHGKGLREQCSR